MITTIYKVSISCPVSDNVEGIESETYRALIGALDSGSDSIDLIHTQWATFDNFKSAYQFEQKLKTIFLKAKKAA
jgi:hypothetical protein